MEKSQRLLLTWLTEDTRLFDVIRPYIGPEDFPEELYGKIARILFAQYEKEGNVNPAKIVNMFEDEEQRRKVASMFHTQLGETLTAQEREKALRETVFRIKQNSIAYRTKHLDPADAGGLQKLVQDKQQLENIKRLHIAFN